MFNVRTFVCLALTALLLSGCAVFGSKETDEHLESELGNLMLDNQILETRLSLAEDRIITLQTQVNEIYEKAHGGAVKDESVKAEAPAIKKEAANPAAQPVAADEAYKKALDTFMARKYKESEAMFIDFGKKYPQSSFMPNAGYWLGESYYAQKRYAEAILNFQSVVNKYPKHQKAADSLLKTGYSYECLGDKANARFYLEQVLEIYPTTHAASLARAMLAGLG
jgi:tol-pal system protein YbgF